MWSLSHYFVCVSRCSRYKYAFYLKQIVIYQHLWLLGLWEYFNCFRFTCIRTNYYINDGVANLVPDNFLFHKTLWFMKTWALTMPLILIISLKATLYQFPCSTSQEASLVDVNWTLFNWQIATNLPAAFDIITILDWKFEMISTSQNISYIQTYFVEMSVCLICFRRHLIVRASGHLQRLSAGCKRYKGFKKPSQNWTNI